MGFFYEGISNKGEIIKELGQKECEDIIYIGDGMKDISAFLLADITIYQKDTISEVQKKADYIQKMESEKERLWEIIDLLKYTTSLRNQIAVIEWNRIIE